jgi:hypothetical protein
MMGEFKFKMPFMKGKEIFITELNDNITLGFYRVKITSDNKHATKLFAFSKNHVYNNISINHALELSEYNFNVELIIDDKPNAYMYDKEIRSSKVFSIWIDKLMKIKKKHPKNKLIKHLMSSLWGSLSRSSNILKTYDEIQAEGLKICMTDKSDYQITDYVWTNSKEYYKLQDMNQPYRYNFRLKSFLTAFGRVKIAEVAIQDLEAVLRIQTDGIVYNKPMKFNISGLIADEKTTGLIKFDHVNKYYKI